MSTTTPGLEGWSAEARTSAHRRQLQRVADALAWSLEPDAAASQLLDAACSTLGASQGWVAVGSDDGRQAHILASRGYDEEIVRTWDHVSMDVDVPMTVVMRTGRPVTYASAEERLRDYPVLLGASVPSFVEASAIVPMVFEGCTIGALAVTFAEVRPINPSDRWFLESLAAQGAGALERARLFKAVQERDDRLRLALAASETWIWEWNLDSDRVTWLPSPPGISADGDGGPAISSPWGLTVEPDDVATIAAVVDRAVQTAEPLETEFRIATPTGSRWLQVSGGLTPGLDGRARRITGTARDVTERKLAELDRNRRLEAEREAGRQRDAFIGVVSHELRTPITTIYGGTRVLARRWRDMGPAARDALLADVSGEADRLFRLVEDLLVLTRVERGSLDVGDEPVSLRPIVDRLLESERARSPEVAFLARIPPDLPSVEGEDVYVEQVLRNLLANAAKYGGPGSTVTVEAAAGPERVTLAVLDDGPGIDETESERLFEPFYRSPSTASVVAGAGIGLYVCRQLATAMGGSIRALRRPEGGAAFELTLRRCADDEA